MSAEELKVRRWYVAPYDPSQVAVGKRFVEVCLSTDYDALAARVKELESALCAAELAVKALDDTGFYVDARATWRALQEADRG